jgi:hypothetical protein
MPRRIRYLLHKGNMGSETYVPCDSPQTEMGGFYDHIGRSACSCCMQVRNESSHKD